MIRERLAPLVRRRFAASRLRRCALLLPGSLAVCLLVPLHPVGAQQPTPSGELPVFGEAVDVRVVNVEVYVTDAEGRPVTGLAREDFEVFEDGKPMAITNFLAVEGGGTAARPPGQEAEREVRGATGSEGRPRQPVDEEQRLCLVLFIDNFNLRTGERRRVMDELRAFVRHRIAATDLVMVVSHRRSLEVLQPFTDDRQQMLEALATADEGPGLGAQHEAVWDGVLRRIERETQEGSAAGAVLPYAELVFDDLLHSVDVMRELVDHLAGLPGRKVVLHLSSGLPMVAAAELFGAVEQKFETLGMGNYMSNYDASRHFEELGRYANTHGVTFHTLDAGGLRTYRSKSASAPGYENARISQRLDSDHVANVQEPLRFLADETGGEAVLNQNDLFPALERIAASWRTYYSLGYVPSHTGDGRLHAIRVKVGRRGVEVRHRRHYRDQDLESRMVDRTRALLYHPFESNPLAIELRMGRGSRQADGNFVVPVEIRIPVGRLVLVPRGELYEGRIRLYVAAVDEQGRVSEVEQTPLGIRIPAAAVEAARSEHWLYTHRLLMRGGRQRIALGLRDEIGAASAFIGGTTVVEGR